jgi:GNAT superfamily N-acetyltransferase
MITLLRTDASDPDFVALVAALDAELAVRDGDDHAFYSQFNKIDSLKQAVVAYEDQIPVACGAIKPFDGDTVELKRMYTIPAHRGKGLASKIMHELEQWAVQLSYGRCILETGINQPEAISLYHKKGYHRIGNYGQYQNVETSLCFEKFLIPQDVA